MSQALGVNVRWMYTSVFTLGTVLGTVGGALVVPTAAASLDMPVELVVEAFAVVVIGGLAACAARWSGALIVGLMRAAAITFLRGVRNPRNLSSGNRGADRAPCRLVR